MDPHCRNAAATAIATTTAILLALTAYRVEATNPPRICANTAHQLHTACRYEARDDHLTTWAACYNLIEVGDRRDCYAEALATLQNARTECDAVRGARVEVCTAVGGGAYAPAFGDDFADRFVNPRDIGDGVTPNPYLPLVAGARWVYESTVPDEDGSGTELERTTVEVTADIKHIDGIDCVVVRDVVAIVEGHGDELVEDTSDWMAQDVDGNVWYCGESAQDFEFVDGDDPELPELVSIDGSWKAGRDGALAGILMRAVPTVGVTERQEIAWGDAEDVFEVTSVTGSATVPATACNGDCVVTRDFSALSPGESERKYYKPGVGRILETSPSGRRTELVEYSIP